MIFTQSKNVLTTATLDTESAMQLHGLMTSWAWSFGVQGPGEDLGFDLIRCTITNKGN